MTTETKRETSIKAKLSFADFRPKVLLAQPDTVREMLVGRVYGHATGKKSITNPTSGEVLNGLTGSFRIEPADVSRAILSSNVLWAPSFLVDPVLEALAEEREDKTSTAIAVQFAHDVHVIRADNPAGYTWQCTPLHDISAEDPLERFRLSITGSTRPVIEAPKEEAPAPAKGKKVS